MKLKINQWENQTNQAKHSTSKSKELQDINSLDKKRIPFLYLKIIEELT